jgi:peptide deformylase
MAARLADSQSRIERKKNRFDRAARPDYQTRAKRKKDETTAMALRRIITLPDPKLRLVSAPLERVDDALRKLMDDMVETMHDAPGIGLAAIQIAEPIRLVVIDLAKKDEPPQPQYFINPEVVWSSEERSVYEEGCLSIPDYYEEVERPASVRARFLDREGKSQEMLAEGLLATALQHEIDHLNGVLFIDYISKLKRDRVIKKFAKIAKRAAEGERPL